ncbi:hypothetical protein B0H11DRAFT_2112011 [Mycena galericulata]|nr:hypothetical protein B0H11DRAFT_2112011 [Mycena galericulata]
MKAKRGVPADAAVVEKELAALDKNLDRYDRILAKQRYVAGDTLTLVDLFHLPYAPYVALGGSDLMTRKPNVAR